MARNSGRFRRRKARGKWPERLSALRPPLAKLSLGRISSTPPARAALGHLANVYYEVLNPEFQRRERPGGARRFTAETTTTTIALVVFMTSPKSASVIAVPACRLWPAGRPSVSNRTTCPICSGARLALSPRLTSPAPRAADQGAARGDIGRLRWRAGRPLLPRQARRRGGQSSARPGYNRPTFVQQGEGCLRLAVRGFTDLVEQRYASAAYPRAQGRHPRRRTAARKRSSAKRSRSPLGLAGSSRADRLYCRR
jgi:hypothetical protein